MRKILCWLTSMLVPIAPFSEAQQPVPTPVSLDPILLRPDVWECDEGALDSELVPLHFEWISATRDVARSAIPGLIFRNRPLNEAILAFHNGKLDEARLSYFNRGDSPALREDEFEALLASITADLNAATGVAPTERGRPSSGTDLGCRRHEVFARIERNQRVEDSGDTFPGGIYSPDLAPPTTNAYASRRGTRSGQGHGQSIRRTRPRREAAKWRCKAERAPDGRPGRKRLLCRRLRRAHYALLWSQRRSARTRTDRQ